VEAGEAKALIFTKVDRASRCTEDFARLLRGRAGGMKIKITRACQQGQIADLALI
jgi:hypothetical protein